ncbi:MAG: hypothetical protein EPO39_19025 [Candidatus Manganitrophaceae bacterium]|nr:MAG: hypothetical protein EPO39_19025 [Candidatus Manganitrophaceae bacterium]
MVEFVLKYGIPVMIVLAFVGFLWAWMLTAVKPPQKSEESRLSGAVNPDWRTLDAGPEGVRRNIFEKIKPQTKSIP